MATTHDERENLLSKIAKLRALAQKAGSPEEAFAAAQKISELVDKYAVTQYELNQANEAHANGERVQYEFTQGSTYNLHKVPMKWAKLIAVPIADACLCMTAYSRESIHMYGTEDNVAIAIDLLDTMLIVLDRTTIKTYRMAAKLGQGKGWKTSFRFGFLQGLGQSIIDQQAQRTALTDTALAVQSDALIKYVYYYIDPSKPKRGAKVHNYNHDAYDNGYQEGYSQKVVQ